MRILIRQMNESALFVLQRIMLVTAVFLLPSIKTQGVDFERDVEPILRNHCQECHGQDEQESKFRVDRLASLLRGGESGEPAVVPSAPDRSFLIKVIRHQEVGLEMPPDGRLGEGEIKTLEAWIESGAKTPERYGPPKETIELTHWAFLPVNDSGSSSIDQLIQDRLAKSGLSKSPRADRATLIRRLFLVVRGVPPTPEQVQDFVVDSRPDAWEQLVASVLDDESFGERFASLWLDLIRFGETHGYEMNRERPTAWPFRDWVIEAFNADMPYDQFVRAQIAGDTTGDPMGTGFLVAGPVDQVKGQDPKLRQVQRMNELDDMINAVGTTFLGLTTGCARCHDHKFDPISQTDYYSLQAVFAGVNHGNGQLPLSKAQQQRLVDRKSQLDDLNEKLAKFLPKRREDGLVRVIDDSDAVALVEPKGRAEVKGEDREEWYGEGYSWWNHQPGEPVIEYQPKLRGKYRIWISWGVGFSSHTTQADYSIKKASGEDLIASVNQQLPAGGMGVVNQTKTWSGFHDAGVHDLTPTDVVLLRGGNDASAVTADVIAFEEVAVQGDEASEPELIAMREPVSSLMNVERFVTRGAKAVRFWIEKTNQSEACLDELEVFSGETNVALASAGARASSSGDFVHPTHKLEHINDGEFGNAKSWISAQMQGGWVQVDFAAVQQIDRIQWARDRTGKYRDRTAVGYRIELMSESGEWEFVAGDSDRSLVAAVEGGKSNYRFEGFSESEVEQGRRWLAHKNELKAEMDKIESTRVDYVGQFSQPGMTHRLYRGDPDSPREAVGPAGIEALTDLSLSESSPEKERRNQLAQWITDADNPLTPRVIVNRIWQFHFGEGIVSTPSDFGTNGSNPTHPELLDWLARELVESGWSLKHIHRLILLSETWCQDHRPDPEALNVDAQNRLLWRYSPRRMDAETIRDSILSVSGHLNLSDRGGPGFSAFEVQMENVRHYHPKEIYGAEDWRRMVYMTKVRQERDQVFGVFDCPDSSMAVAKRSRSTTPLQALSLLNSGFVVQQSELLAERLAREESDTDQRVVRAWHLCFQRTPSDSEKSLSLDLVNAHGWTAFCRALLNANEFVFIP